MYNPPSRMGNLGYLLRNRLKYIFSVEITRSRNNFYLQGILYVTVIKYLMGEIILQEGLYTPPFQTTANMDGYVKLHIDLHGEMDPLGIIDQIRLINHY
jgi:hypothetical protein